MKHKFQVVVALAIVAVMAFTSMAPAFAQDSVDDMPGGGWWTGTQVQNVGTTGATLTVTSYDMDASVSPVSTSPISLAKDASTTLLPADLNTADDFQGSATISSDQPLRAIVNTTNLLSSPNYGVSGGLAAAQYQGVNNPDTEVNFPLAKNSFYGKSTTFYVQNAGTNATTFQADFIFIGGNCSITTPTVQPNRMTVISAAANSSCPSGNNGLGSLKVTSSEPMAGVVMEHGSEVPAVQLQSTRGFAPSDADTAVYAPIIKSEYGNRFTGLQIQNATTGPVDVTVTYKGIYSQNGAATNCAGTSYTSSKSGLASNESVTFVHLTSDSTNPLPAGCLASATVSATGNVVAIVNESFVKSFLDNGGNGGRQEATTYAAFAGNSGTAKISAPLFKENSYKKGTGLQVQNVGSANASSVVATFIQSGSGTSYVTNPISIAAGAAYTFLDVRNQAASFWNGTAMPSSVSDSSGVFAVVVTADQPVVAIANETTYPIGRSEKQQDKNNYEGFNLTP